MEQDDNLQYFENKIYAALKIPKNFMTGQHTSVTKSLAQHYLAFSKNIQKIQNFVTGNVSKDEYVRFKFPEEMKRQKGKKRLRKKKAKKLLQSQWAMLQMCRLIAGRRINYAEISRKMFTVEPMPDPVSPIYMKDIDILDAVTGVRSKNVERNI